MKCETCGKALTPGTSIRFVVPGHAVPCGRPRVFQQRTGEVRLVKGALVMGMRTRAVNPKGTTGYKKLVRAVATMTAIGKRWPASVGSYAADLWIYRTHRTDGDADNFAKSILDAVKGVLWPDDRYVDDLGVHLRFDARNPRAEVFVTRNDEEDPHASIQPGR